MDHQGAASCSGDHGEHHRLRDVGISTHQLGPRAAAEKFLDAVVLASDSGEDSVHQRPQRVPVAPVHAVVTAQVVVAFEDMGERADFSAVGVDGD